MDKKVQRFLEDYGRLKPQDKVKKLDSVEKDLFDVVLKQLETTETVIKKLSGASKKDCKTLSGDVEMSQKCLEHLYKFIPVMDVNIDVKFRILKTFVPLVIRMGDVSVRIVTDITQRILGSTSTVKTNEEANYKNELAKLLTTFSDAIGRVFECIVDHDVVELIFHGEKVFEKRAKKDETDLCRNTIQSMCLQFCSNVCLQLTSHLGDLAFNNNRCSEICRHFLDAITKLLRCYKCAVTPLRHILKYTSEQFWGLERGNYKALLANFYELSVLVTFCLRSLNGSDKSGAAIQDMVSYECRKVEVERGQAEGVVISLVKQKQQPSLDELKFGLYWTQIFSFSALKCVETGGILCGPDRMYISRSTLVEVHRETLHSDVTIFIQPMDGGKFLQEFPDTKNAEADGIDAVVAAFTTQSRFILAGPRNLYFDLVVGYDEKLITMMYKSKKGDKWDKGCQLKRKDEMWVTQTDCVGDMVIYCTFPRGVADLTQKGLTVDIANTNYGVSFPAGCVSSNQEVQYKLIVLDEHRVNNYQRNYPSIFDDMFVSHVINVNLSQSPKLKKPAQLTFPRTCMTVGETDSRTRVEDVSLILIEGNNAKMLDNRPLISRDCVRFEVDHFSQYACVRTRKRPRSRDGVQTYDATDDQDCTSDLQNSSQHSSMTNKAATDTRSAQWPIIKNEVSTEKMPDKDDTPDGAKAQWPMDRNNGSNDGDKEPFLNKLGIIDRIRILFGWASPCNFILSYKEHANSPGSNNPRFSFLLDCIESLQDTKDDRHRKLVMSGWSIFNPIVPFGEELLAKHSLIRVKVNGNLTLVGNDKLSLTFNPQLQSSNKFTAELKRGKVSTLTRDESIVFLFLFKPKSEVVFNWALHDTKELKGHDSDQGSGIVQSKEKIERLVTNSMNLGRVHQYLSQTNDGADTRAFLTKMKIPLLKSRTPAMEIGIIGARFFTMQQEKGTSEAFHYLMGLLDAINRSDISLLLLQMALLDKELPPLDC